MGQDENGYEADIDMDDQLIGGDIINIGSNRGQDQDDDEYIG